MTHLQRKVGTRLANRRDLRVDRIQFEIPHVDSNPDDGRGDLRDHSPCVTALQKPMALPPWRHAGGSHASTFRAETREIFRRFAIETVATRYTVAGGKWSDVTEIVVTGPSAEPTPASRDLLSFSEGG
jgi:hypothetical protein